MGKAVEAVETEATETEAEAVMGKAVEPVEGKSVEPVERWRGVEAVEVGVAEVA